METLSLDQSLFIRAIQLKYSLSREHLLGYMESAADKSQFTAELAKKIMDQWKKEDPDEFGDPFGLWDWCSTGAELQFTRPTYGKDIILPKQS